MNCEKCGKRVFKTKLGDKHGHNIWLDVLEKRILIITKAETFDSPPIVEFRLAYTHHDETCTGRRDEK